MPNPFQTLGSEAADDSSSKVPFPVSDTERTLLIKNESFVYRIPPQIGKGKVAEIKLEELGSNKLFASCPIETYPGPAVQQVVDSSRYFVIKVVEEGGKSAHLGLGFADRSDSFDLNTTLHDHFKGLKVEEQIEKEIEEPPEKLDLALKEGETIKVSINIPRKSRTKSPATRTGAGLSLAPAPGKHNYTF